MTDRARRAIKSSKLLILSLFCGAIFLAAAGCGDKQTGTSTAAPATTAEAYNPKIDPADFVSQVDNEFFPLKPGTTYIYEGTSEEGAEKNEVVVTDETKTILGVQCTVVHDRVWLEGDLIEETFDWYAQDKDGNVWYFGEDVNNYENGEIVDHDGAWEAGKDGAQPGYILKADVKVGDSWRQEYLAGEAEDMGEVIGLDQTVTVKAGSYQGCVKTRDWTPLDPGVEENKLYCPAAGVVKDTIVKGGSDVSELVEIRNG